MKKVTLYQVDAFTNQKFRGNPAGVVLNADALDEQDMLNIARELNNSETAFVFSADGSDHDVKIRFFTPKVEVPVCGHATVAAHYVRAMELGLGSCTVMHKIGIGVLPVEIIRTGCDSGYRIMMTQGTIELGPPLPAAMSNRILQALGLTEQDMDPRCPLLIASTGNSKVMVGIRERRKLHALTPDMSALTSISALIQCSGYFVFTLDSDSDDIMTHSRMFAPAIGIYEDPVTGNAHGPLGPYLMAHNLVQSNDPVYTFRGKQGEAIGRGGIVDVQVLLSDGKPFQVKIGGKAVIVYQTTLCL